jgi:hypothetical protein
MLAERPPDFALWPKQYELADVVRNSPVTGIEEIFLIGPIGSTKTFAMAYVDANVCWQFPGSIIPVGRKDLSEAQIGTFVVYLEALEKMGLKQGRHYRLRQAPNDLRISFSNGSIIQFIGMNKSRDREWSKLKITATKASVDEVDDVDEGGYNMLFSRTGRKNENGAPRCIVSACNPNDKWTKQKIYLPWLKRINRRPDNMSDEEWNKIVPLPKNKVVIEFTMRDSPLYPTGYYDRFIETASKPWQQRYLFNNWSYRDDENSLFKSRTMDLLTIDTLSEGQKYIGVDPNGGGKDRASIVLWEGDTIVDAEVYTTEQLKKLAEPDELDPLNVGSILGRLTVNMMKREGVGYLYVGGDVNGAGQGWLTYMLSNGYKVHQFISGAAPYQTKAQKEKKLRAPYTMLRDQVFHRWSIDLENRKAFFYANMPHLATLKKELQLHEADTTAKIMKVTAKDEIKLMLGTSPDIADSAMIGYWVKMIMSTKNPGASKTLSVGKSIDELYNQSRDF